MRYKRTPPLTGRSAGAFVYVLFFTQQRVEPTGVSSGRMTR